MEDVIPHLLKPAATYKSIYRQNKLQYTKHCPASCNPELPSGIFLWHLGNTAVQNYAVPSNCLLFSSAVVTSANEQQIPKIAEGHPFLRLVYIHTIHIFVHDPVRLHRNDADTFWESSCHAYLKTESAWLQWFFCNNFTIVGYGCTSNQFPHRCMLVNA